MSFSLSWTQEDKSLPCRSHPAFGVFLVCSLITCAKVVQVLRGHNSSVWCCLGKPGLTLANFLGNLQFPLLPLWEVIRHNDLICLLPIYLFDLFVRHLEPHCFLKRDAGKPRLHTVLRVSRAESRGAAFLQHKHIWRSGRGRKNKEKQKKEENVGISSSNPTKILEWDRGCPKGSQLLGKCSMLGKNGAGNSHKMFVFQVFCTLPLPSWHSRTLCLFASSSYPSCS